MGFVLFCLHHKKSHFEFSYIFDLRLCDNRNKLVDVRYVSSWCEFPEIDGDALNELWVTLYPKNRIPKKYHINQPWNFLAVFDSSTRINDHITHPNIKRYGFQLIYNHDYPHNNFLKLLDHEKGHDDAVKKPSK